MMFRAAVAIAIAVSITVAVIIFIFILIFRVRAYFSVRHVIDHEAQQIRAGRIRPLDDFRHVLIRRFRIIHNGDNAADFLMNHHRVAHDVHRRRVDDYIIIHILQFSQELPELFGRQQFRRVRRQGAGRQ